MESSESSIEIHGMADFHESNHPIALKWYRIINSFLNLGHLIYIANISTSIFLVYLTNWGLSLTTVFFISSALSYKYNSLKLFCYILFEIIWPINFVITIFYWCYLFPIAFPNNYWAKIVSAHTVPIVGQLIDFSLNNIIIYRAHYKFPACTIVVYLFVLVPYTLSAEAIYAGITFTNAITYLMFFVLFIVFIASFEIGRYIRVRTWSSVKSHVLNFSLTEKEVIN